MKSIYFILVVLLISFSYVDKGIKSHVKENLHIVKSINPEDTNYDDLAEIGAAIGDTRVVLLGEQCHGDGATFKAKSRLIKYLHEKKGFNVLAFEADFFTLNEGINRETLKDSSLYYKRVEHGINNIWSNSVECNDLLFNYIPATYSTAEPLVITGFDSQFYGLMGSNRLGNFLKTHIRASSFNKSVWHLLDQNFYNSLDTLMASVYKSREQHLNPTPEYISLIKYFEKSLDTLLAHALQGSGTFDVQVLKNIKAFSTQILNIKDGKTISVRDSMMAENLEWLLENKFRKEKIIVWAANSHTGKQNYYITRLIKPMGWFLSQKLKTDDFYTLAFTSREGTHGIFKSEPINYSRRAAPSFETWIPDTINYAFLDLKKRPDLASESFPMRAIGHGNLEKNWQTAFDGLFYIREMHPSHRLENKTD